MEELKPCPFCGGEAEIDINDIQEPDMFWRYAVGCSFFGCIAYSRFSTHFHTKEEAITAWNTRAESICTMHESYDIGLEYDPFDGWSCSKCKMIVSYDTDKPKYCPNCGAKVVS